MGGRKVQALPQRVKFHGGKYVNSSFLRLALVLSEVFQAIFFENHTSIHHNLTEADPWPKEYFSGLFSSVGIWTVSQFSKTTLKHSKFYIHSLNGYFLK